MATRSIIPRVRPIVAALGLGLAFTGLAARAQSAPPPLFAEPIAAAPGFMMRMEVSEFPPAPAAAPLSTAGLRGHRHPASTYVYVVSGAVISRLGDGPEKTYRAGDSWRELPNQAHYIVNASHTEGARLVVSFIYPAGAEPLTRPLDAASH